MPCPLHLRGTAAVAILLATSLGGCDDSGPAFAPACPQLTLLRDAADLTRFRPGGRDLTDMMADARISAVPASCSYATPQTVTARMSVTVQVSRGPAAQGRTVSVPYFIAVTEGDQVRDEQDYTLNTSFPANVDSVTANGQEITLRLPITADKSAAAYKIYVGFRLNPDELAYNRARGPR